MTPCLAQPQCCKLIVLRYGSHNTTFWHFVSAIKLNLLRSKAKSIHLSSYQLSELKIIAVLMQPHRPVLTATVRSFRSRHFMVSVSK